LAVPYAEAQGFSHWVCCLQEKCLPAPQARNDPDCGKHAPGTLRANAAAPCKRNAPADVEFTLIAESRNLTDVCKVRKDFPN
jgi:hypothetical protein